MAQESAWDREYRHSKLLTKDNKPQQDMVRFVRFLKDEGLSMDGSNVVDLGFGAGRNSFYCASLGAEVAGLEISRTAITMAEKEARAAGFTIDYRKGSIGEPFPFEDRSFDVALDVTSSNSLSEAERAIYLSETHRVLRTGGYFFVKALCREGDENAKYLLKHSPGPERDTYIMPDLGIVERVWSSDDFRATYGQHFSILQLEKKTNYPTVNGRIYKRNYWIAYMKKD